MDTLIGTSIGGYTLLKLLGTGGMGSVYLASDPTIDQQVAVKIIRTDMDSYTDFTVARMALDRFRQEARAVARLDHLHILPLYRYGEDVTPQGQRAYMIMQYRPEGSLWDWLRRRADRAAGSPQATSAAVFSGLPTNWPLGLDEVTTYIHQAASALQYAHDNGIVHRDVKPANFLLRVDQHDKNVHLLLSDFGLAKIFTGSSSTNTILGTPIYMAPEQFEGAARPASDQYALAVMVYFLLVGRVPFEGDPMQLMHQHLSAEVPSLLNFNPGIPSALNEVFARAMAKRPEQRFPSVSAFAETFARVAQDARLAQPETSIPASGKSGSLKLPGKSAMRRVLPGPLVLQSLSESATGKDKSEPAPTASAFTPTVYVNPSPGTQASGVGPVAQASSVDASDPSLQPTIASARTLTPVPDAQQPQEKQPVSRRRALGWLVGAGALVVAGAGAGVYFFTRGSDQSRQPLHILRGHTEAVTSLGWLPDGSRLTTGSLDATARIWSSDGGSLATLNATSAIYALAWDSDGATLATGEDDHSVQFWNASNFSLKGREPSWGAPVYALAWRGNSSLFVGTAGGGLRAFDLADDDHLGKGTSVIMGLALSPDKSLIAVALASGKVYFSDLSNNWMITTVFPSTHGAALAVAWSPDGGMVAVGYADGNVVVYDATSRQVKSTLAHRGSVHSVTWSPNSTATTPLLVSGADDGSVTVWKLADSGNPIVYTGHSDAVLAVSWGPNLLASASKDRTAILWQPPA